MNHFKATVGEKPELFEVACYADPPVLLTFSMRGANVMYKKTVPVQEPFYLIGNAMRFLRSVTA
jgi:hypothetical protein